MTFPKMSALCMATLLLGCPLMQASHIHTTVPSPDAPIKADYPSLGLISGGTLRTMSNRDISLFRSVLENKFVADFLNDDPTLIFETTIEDIGTQEKGFIKLNLIVVPNGESLIQNAAVRISQNPALFFLATNGSLPRFIVLRVLSSETEVILTTSDTPASTVSTTAAPTPNGYSSTSVPTHQPTTKPTTSRKITTTESSSITSRDTSTRSATSSVATIQPTTFRTTSISQTLSSNCVDDPNPGFSLTSANSQITSTNCSMLASQGGCDHTLHGTLIRNACPKSCGVVNCITSTPAPPIKLEQSNNNNDDERAAIIFMAIMVPLLLIAMLIIAWKLYSDSRNGKWDVQSDNKSKATHHASMEIINDSFAYNQNHQQDPNVMFYSQDMADRENRQQEMMMLSPNDSLGQKDTFDRLKEGKSQYEEQDDLVEQPYIRSSSISGRTPLSANTFEPPPNMRSQSSQDEASSGPAVVSYSKSKIISTLVTILASNDVMQTSKIISLFDDDDLAITLQPSDVSSVVSSFLQENPGSNIASALQKLAQQSDKTMTVLEFINAAKDSIQLLHASLNPSSPRISIPGPPDHEPEFSTDGALTTDSETNFVDNPVWASLSEIDDTTTARETDTDTNNEDNRVLNLNDNDNREFSSDNDYDTSNENQGVATGVYSTPTSINLTQESKWVHVVGEMTSGEAIQWVSRHLIPDGTPSNTLDGHFIIRKQAKDEPNVYTLSVIYRGKITSHQILLSEEDGDLTTINRRNYGSITSIDELVHVLSNEPLPVDTLVHRPWPVRLTHGVSAHTESLEASDTTATQVHHDARAQHGPPHVVHPQSPNSPEIVVTDTESVGGKPSMSLDDSLALDGPEWIEQQKQWMQNHQQSLNQQHRYDSGPMMSDLENIDELEAEDYLWESNDSVPRTVPINDIDMARQKATDHRKESVVSTASTDFESLEYLLDTLPAIDA